MRGTSAALALVLELVVRAEHRLGMQCGVGDDAMYVKEESGEATGEVGKEAFRHRSKQPLDIVREVLIVVFLQRHPTSALSAQQIKQRTLLRKARRRSWTDFPSYFRNLPRLSMKSLSSRECQSAPTTSHAPNSSVMRFGSLGSRHMISNRSEASWRNDMWSKISCSICQPWARMKNS